MTFAGAFQHLWSAQSANKTMQARIFVVWAALKKWPRGVLGQLPVEEPGDDPTAHFSFRDWADLPPHHPSSAE